MFVDELNWRGLLHQVSSPKLADLMSRESLTLYAGFDPTADSLHVGHLLPLIALKRAELLGHKPIALIGGATALIGDPSGKSQERNLLTNDVVCDNVNAIFKQIRRIIPTVAVDNNIFWFKSISILDFLRNTGKDFSVNAMLNRDAVKSRLESDNGISFTEFSYILLQAFDFLHLNRTAECRLQIGGSDQWGNITSGIDLIRRDGREAFGVTLPLITNSSGEKFGKTAKGAVWLDANKTTPQELFQFFFNTPDADVVMFLRFFTFLDQAAIAELEQKTINAPEERAAQIALAKAVCQIVHGVDGQEILVVQIDSGISLLDVLVQIGFCPSRSDARNQIKQNGIKINNTAVTDFTKTFNESDFSSEVILSRGKKLKCKLQLRS